MISEMCGVVCSRGRAAVKEAADPVGLREQVVLLFDEWGRLSEEQPANQIHDKFVLKLQTAGFLKVHPSSRSGHLTA